MNAEPQPKEKVFGAIRQSNLRTLDTECPASAYAKAVEGRENPQGEGALRGTVIHHVFARYVRHLQKTGRQTDFEAAEDIAAEVLKIYPELNFTQRMEVMEQARNIASGFLAVPENLVEVELPLKTLIRLANGWSVLVTGTLDLLEIDSEEGIATITDAKSNHTIFPDSQVESDFQLMLYALLVLDNYPDVDMVKGRLWFTRFNVMVPRRGEAVWGREEIEELRKHLAIKLEAFYFGDLRKEHIPGSWCAYCPKRRPGDCIEWRRWYGNNPPPLTNEHQAVKMARQILTLEDALSVRRKQLQDYAKERGPVSVGSGDKAQTFGYFEKESVEYDLDELWNVLENLEDTIGRQHMADIFNLDRTKGHQFSKLMKLPEVRDALADIAETKVSTRWGHEAKVVDE